MCRTKELGGRRCPSHSNPQLVAARNAQRRQKYAASKKSAVAPAQQYSFQVDEDELVTSVDMSGDVWDSYISDGEKFLTKIQESEQKVEMIDALLEYTHKGYRPLRDHLNRSEEEQAGNEYMVGLTKNLDDALHLAEPPSEPRTLFRGMEIPTDEVTDDEIDGWLDSHFPVDGVFSQKSFMSTTLSMYKAAYVFGNARGPKRSVIFEIITKQGAPLGTGTSDLDTRELEILMPREARFKVVGIKKNITFELAASSHPDAFPDEITRTIIQIVDAEEKS
jgi:hypothetical protein